MIRSKLYEIGLIFALIISVCQPGCNGDDDDDETKDDTGGSNGGNTDAGDSKDGVTFTGVVKNVVTSEVVPDIEVVPLSNDVNFTELGPKVKTDENGEFAFKGLEEDVMCVKVLATEGEAAMVDTYSCNVSTDQQALDVSSLPLSIASGISQMLYPGVEVDSTVASASGAIFYKTEDGYEIPVDCATIEVEEATDQTDIFYFDGVMPVTEATQTDNYGRFLVTRLPPGQVTINAMVDGEKIGSVSIPIQAPAKSGATYNSNVTWILADEIGDPTPGSNCTNN